MPPTSPAGRRQRPLGAPVHRLVGPDRRAHAELDLAVGVERDVADRTGVGLPIEGDGHRPGGRPDLGGAELLAPDVEELAERVDLLVGGLDVDHAVGRVGVEPVEASAPFDERPLGGLSDLQRWGDADALRHLLLDAVHEDGQVGVDVVRHLLAAETGDPVDRLPVGRGVDRGERGARRDRDALGAGGPRRGLGAARTPREQGVRRDRPADDQDGDEGGGPFLGRPLGPATRRRPPRPGTSRPLPGRWGRRPRRLLPRRRDTGRRGCRRGCRARAGGGRRTRSAAGRPRPGRAHPAGAHRSGRTQGGARPAGRPRPGLGGRRTLLSGRDRRAGAVGKVGSGRPGRAGIAVRRRPGRGGPLPVLRPRLAGRRAEGSLGPGRRAAVAGHAAKITR